MLEYGKILKNNGVNIKLNTTVKNIKVVDRVVKVLKQVKDLLV